MIFVKPCNVYVIFCIYNKVCSIEVNKLTI